MIDIKNLKKSYGKQLVLKEVNLHFEAGKVYGIVGENGAGKTTLFKCIAQLETFEGSIAYHGILKNDCGFLPTNPYFLSKITGKEYLQLLCNARNIVEPNITAKNIFDLPLNKYATTYSTGMKKKLALTGILLQKNKVFVLDEPFNGVDLQSNILIQAIIKKLKAQQHIVIIASHILAALNPLCDVLHLLQNGQIKQSASPQDFETIEQQMKASFLEGKLKELEGLVG